MKTPPLGRVLNSITRLSLLELAGVNNIEAIETALMPDELYQADEMFCCHTGLKVVPIKKFENKQMPAPGAVTQKLAEAINQILTFNDDRYLHWFQSV